MNPRMLRGLVFLATIATAPASDAQQATRVPKIGVLSATSQVASAPFITAFRQGLRDLGYVEGKTVLVEVRSADAAVERLPELARQLVVLKPDVIVVTN